eukprot:symbB.v1.2.006075.t1/scaffold332.1/size322744/10
MAMAVAADEDSYALERWTSKLSSSFAVWIMSTECAVKIQFSVMQVFLPDAEWLYFVLPALSLFALWRWHQRWTLQETRMYQATLCFSLTPELRALNKNPMSTCSKAIATVKLWPDLTLWLISLTNVAFGSLGQQSCECPFAAGGFCRSQICGLCQWDDHGHCWSDFKDDRVYCKERTLHGFGIHCIPSSGPFE